jgi:hypothetical protein
MTELLAKLFSRGNRSSDRFYADRARPDRDAKRLARENRDSRMRSDHDAEEAKKK